MGLYWNYTDREKLKCWEGNLDQCHFVHHISHTACPGFEARLPMREAGYLPPDPWHGTSGLKLIEIAFKTSVPTS